jgi:RNA recognition motif-containing protein
LLFAPSTSLPFLHAAPFPVTNSCYCSHYYHTHTHAHTHNLRSNAYLTLFVGRLSYDTNERKLRREFEQYGPIRKVATVADLEGKPRGYAFIEFEKEEDMMTAFKRSDGKKIDGRRIVVDVERGR